MTFYVSDIIGNGADAESNAFRPAIAEVADTWAVIVDARANQASSNGKMLVRAASGLSGSGFTAMRRSHLSDYGLPESGYQDDADDPDLCRQLARRGLLRQWLGANDFPVTLTTTLAELPGTLTQLRSRIQAIQPGVTFNGRLSGSSLVGDALEIALPQISLRLSPRPAGQSGTFTDNFNGAGSNTDLASWTPSGGTAWTLVDGTGSWAQVSSSTNRLITNNTDATGASWRCDDQASADQYLQAKWQNTVISFWCCRHVSRTSYIGVRGNAATPKCNLFRNNAGFTSLGTGATTVVAGDTIRLECSGNNLTVYLNGVAEIGPVSETHNNTQTRQGVHVRNDGTVGWADDFEAGVLAAGGLSIPVAMHHYKQMAGTA